MSSVSFMSFDSSSDFGGSTHPGLRIIEQFRTMSLRRLPALPNSLIGAAVFPPATLLAESSSANRISVSVSRMSQSREITSPRMSAAGGLVGSARNVMVLCNTSPIE